MTENQYEKAQPWLQTAILSFAKNAPSRPIWDGKIRSVGDIVRVDSLDLNLQPAVLGYVTHVDKLLGMVSLVALSPDVEMQSEVDYLLPAQNTGLGYDVIALADVIGYAWFIQLSEPLGRIDLETVHSCPVGMEVRGERDCRWKWKEDQLASMNHLTAECAYELLENTAKPIFDTAAFASTDTMGPERVAAATTKAMRLVQDGIGRLDIGSVIDGYEKRTITPDTMTLIYDVVARSPKSTQWSKPNATIRVQHIKGRSQASNPDLLLNLVSNALRSGQRCVRVFSEPEFWDVPQDERGDVFGVFDNHAGDYRYQLVALRVPTHTS